MKKKIIFLVLCVVLLLTFMSSSFADIDLKYKLRGHPWDDPCLTPAGDTTSINVLMLSIGPNTILTFTLNRIKSATENINQSNINREKWIKAPKESAKRSPQR
jgi:type 1 fimbria pilin